MAKRFTSTEIWGEDWFLDMPIEYKLFWYYILSNCDHAGLFRVNLRAFCNLNQVKLNLADAIAYFNSNKDRIRIVSENVWLIEDFFNYQYGETFNPNNRVHESIQKLYNKHNIKMTSIRGLTDLKDRVKDKDKDKDIKGSMRGKLKGKEFSEEFVFFEDGTSQELGKSQKIRLMHNDIKPEDVTKGQIH
tara:strand:- start:3943 stop:4509 length:567 start_codon:yes stop_codon:yes gene_type:complete